MLGYIGRIWEYIYIGINIGNNTIGINIGNNIWRMNIGNKIWIYIYIYIYIYRHPHWMSSEVIVINQTTEKLWKRKLASGNRKLPRFSTVRLRKKTLQSRQTWRLQSSESWRLRSPGRVAQRIAWYPENTKTKLLQMSAYGRIRSVRTRESSETCPLRN